MNQTDSKLIELAVSGDIAAFEILAQRYRRSLYALAYSRLGNAEDAHDASQQAIIRAYQHLTQLTDCERFVPWLRRILINECRMQQRAQIKYAHLDCLRRIGHEEKLLDLRIAVDQALDVLTDREREAVVMYYAADLSALEIAAWLGISETAVKGRLRNSKRKLRKEMIDMIEVKSAATRVANNIGERFFEMLASARVLSLVYSSDGRYLASGHDNCKVSLWSTESGEEVRTFRAIGFVDNVLFHPDGKHLFAAAADRIVRLWDVETGETVAERCDNGRSVAPVWSPNGRLLALRNDLFNDTPDDITRRIVIRSASDLSLVCVVPVNQSRGANNEDLEANVGHLFSPDSRRMLYGKVLLREWRDGPASSAVTVCNASTGEHERSIVIEGTYACCPIAYRSETSLLVYCGVRQGEGAELELRDCNPLDGSTHAAVPLKGITEWTSLVTLSGDGSLLTMQHGFTAERTVSIIDTANGEVVRSFTQKGWSSNAAFSPSSRRYAVPGPDNRVQEFAA